jgi:hypothetical protein
MDLLFPEGRLHRRRRGLLTAVLFSSALLGCAEPAPLLDVLPPAAGGSDRLSGAGAFLPSASVAMRQLLPNDTALPGENHILWLPSPRSGRPMSLTRILDASGPLPHPFEFAIHSDFAPVAGGAGGLSYLSAQPAADVTCVLVAGLGRAGHGASGPMLMRNCVRGSAAEALAPVVPL